MRRKVIEHHEVTARINDSLQVVVDIPTEAKFFPLVEQFIDGDERRLLKLDEILTGRTFNRVINEVV